MSLPPSGWLPADILTEITTPTIPLPTPFTGNYSEGGSSVDTVAPEEWKEFSAIEIGAHDSFSAGFDSNHASTLVVVLSRDEVFGAILVDSFNPPVLSMFFEFDAYTQLACVDGLVATVPLFGSPQEGEVTDPVEIVGTPTVYTEEP